ncbi:MAG TPA: DUF4012 domain-containing protein, partial [Ktedonobacteraceae bacterium]|nr:DUF4012 domain-containing protein [Ktedonobacteraceae bacterium]
QQNFRDALATFARLNGDVNLLPDVLTDVPAFGSRLRAAKHLIPMALDVAQAGLAGCTIISTLTSLLHGSSNKSPGLTMPDLTVLKQNLQQIKMALAQAVGLVNQLQPGDLQFDPSLGKMISEFHMYLPLIQQGVDQATGLFSVLPQVLGIGTPSHYLVEILDSTELRPGGGFIGNYGIVTLGGGQVTSAQVTDTYLLDNSSKRTHHVPIPGDYSWFPFSGSWWGWGLRDSNLDADFPTSARNGEILYNLEGGTLPLAGVVAITPELMERFLALTGPIAVPEYHETVTAQNLIDLIHYHQLIEEAANGLKPVPSSDGYSSDRKHFTALLGQYALARVHALPGSLLPGLFEILANSLQTKDLQIYFNAMAAENLLQVYHVDDSIQSPVGDGIFVVDANITPSKANEYLATTVNDQVTIDRAGAAVHRTVIKFTWTKPGLTGRDFYGSTRYKDFVRVYVPAGSVLQTQEGWSPYSTGIAFGRRFWGGKFELNYPLSGAITLTWSFAGAAQEVGHSWQYHYLMQHQAGSQQKMYLQVALPSCAAIALTSAGVVADSKRQAHLAQILSQDTAVSIDYTCSG